MTGYVFDPDSFVFNYKHVDGFHLFITGYNGWHSDIEIPNLTNGNIIWGIYMNAFSNNLTLKSVKIDKRSEKTGFGPKIIMEEAFMNCRSLEKAVICDENITIERGAFAGCPKLTIYGYEGSTAEKYAFSNGIKFVDIGELSSSYDKNAHYVVKNGNVVDTAYNQSFKGKAEDYYDATKKLQIKCMQRIELLYHNTGKTLEEVISVLLREGFDKSVILASIVSILKDVTWDD